MIGLNKDTTCDQLQKNIMELQMRLVKNKLESIKMTSQIQLLELGKTCFEAHLQLHSAWHCYYQLKFTYIDKRLVSERIEQTAWKTNG